MKKRASRILSILLATVLLAGIFMSAMPLLASAAAFTPPVFWQAALTSFSQNADGANVSSGDFGRMILSEPMKFDDFSVQLKIKDFSFYTDGVGWANNMTLAVGFANTSAVFSDTAEGDKAIVFEAKPFFNGSQNGLRVELFQKTGKGIAYTSDAIDDALGYRSPIFVPMEITPETVISLAIKKESGVYKAYVNGVYASEFNFSKPSTKTIIDSFSNGTGYVQTTAKITHGGTMSYTVMNINNRFMGNKDVPGSSKTVALDNDPTNVLGTSDDYTVTTIGGSGGSVISSARGLSVYHPLSSGVVAVTRNQNIGFKNFSMEFQWDKFYMYNTDWSSPNSLFIGFTDGAGNTGPLGIKGSGYMLLLSPYDAGSALGNPTKSLRIEMFAVRDGAQSDRADFGAPPLIDFVIADPQTDSTTNPVTKIEVKPVAGDTDYGFFINDVYQSALNVFYPPNHTDLIEGISGSNGCLFTMGATEPRWWICDFTINSMHSPIGKIVPAPEIPIADATWQTETWLPGPNQTVFGKVTDGFKTTLPIGSNLSYTRLNTPVKATDFSVDFSFSSFPGFGTTGTDKLRMALLSSNASWLQGKGLEFNLVPFIHNGEKGIMIQSLSIDSQNETPIDSFFAAGEINNETLCNLSIVKKGGVYKAVFNGVDFLTLTGFDLVLQNDFNDGFGYFHSVIDTAAQIGMGSTIKSVNGFFAGGSSDRNISSSAIITQFGTDVTVTSSSEFTMPSSVYEVSVSSGKLIMNAKAASGATASGTEKGSLYAQVSFNKPLDLSASSMISLRFKNIDGAPGFTLQGTVNGENRTLQGGLLAYDINKKKIDLLFDADGKALIPSNFDGYLAFDLSDPFNFANNIGEATFGSMNNFSDFGFYLSWDSDAAQSAFSPCSFEVSDVTAGTSNLSLNLPTFGKYKTDYENDIIFGIKPGTKAQELLDRISAGTKGLSALSGQVQGDAPVVTGMMLNVNGTEYETVIFGDVSGDGNISAADLASSKAILLDIGAFSNAQKIAAAVSGSGTEASIIDLVYLKKHIVSPGTTSISGNDFPSFDDIDPDALLKDTDFAAGFRNDWVIGGTYTESDLLRKGEVLTYRNLGSLTPVMIGGGNDRGKAWEILTEDHMDKYTYMPANRYEFISGTEGFTIQNGGSSPAPSQANDILYVYSRNTSAALTSPAFSMSADNAKYLRFRFSNPTSQSTMKIQWITTADTAWNDTKSVTIAITPNLNSFTTYTAVLKDIAAWTGTVTQIRFGHTLNLGIGVSQNNQYKYEYIRFADEYYDRYFGNKLNINPVVVSDTANELKVTKYDPTNPTNKMSEITSDRQGTLTVWDNSKNHPNIEGLYFNNADKESWPAIYVFQNFKRQVPLSDYSKVNVSFDITLDQCDLIDSGNSGRTTEGVQLSNEAVLSAQVFLRKKDDPSQMYYAMLRLYATSDEYFEHMDGDYIGAKFYWPQSYKNTPLTVGQQTNVSFELKELMAQGFMYPYSPQDPKRPNKNGFKLMDTAVDDYVIDGFYVGWEYIGNYETQFTLSNVSMKGSNTDTYTRTVGFDGGTDGFTGLNGTSVSTSDGKLNMNFTGNGTIVSPSAFNLDADQNKIIKIRLSNNIETSAADGLNGVLGALEWKKNGSGTWTTTNKDFKVMGSSRGYTDYYINMSHVDGWNGNITDLKLIFKPVNQTSANILSIDYIKFDILH